jgi:hypothetical protein
VGNSFPKTSRDKVKTEAEAEAERLVKEAEKKRIEQLKQLGRAKMGQILSGPRTVPKPEPEPPKSSIWKTLPQTRNRKRKETFCQLSNMRGKTTKEVVRMDTSDSLAVRNWRVG